MATLAVVCYLSYLAVILGVRIVVQRRRAGSAGVRLMAGRIGSTEWFASVLFGNGMLANGIAPALVLLGVVEPIAALDTTAVHVLGILVFAAGFVTTFSVQLAMGKSWRIGVDPSAVTALVTGGPFAIVRNPIFAAILLTFSGLALMVPSILAFAALALLTAGIELTVRAVEEPYLLRTHGADYADYAGRVGRLLPGIGRLRAARQPA